MVKSTAPKNKPPLPIIPYSGRAMVDIVREWALEKHGDQKDKLGRPYEEHLRAVAEGAPQLVKLNLVKPYGRSYAGDLTHLEAAGWLHDVIEDVWSLTVDDLFDMGFPKPVIAIVVPMTKKTGEEQIAYLTRIIAAGPPAWVLKLADLYHNTMPSRFNAKDEKGKFLLSGDTQVRLLTKYVRAIKVLEALLEVPANRRRGWYTEQHLEALKRAGHKSWSSTGYYSSQTGGVPPAAGAIPPALPGVVPINPPAQVYPKPYKPSVDYEERQKALKASAAAYDAQKDSVGKEVVGSSAEKDEQIPVEGERYS